jgi:hypothetical protein
MDKQKYGEKFQDHLLDQYKLYVEMSDRTSARRNQMNSFYTSLLSGLLALITIVINKDILSFQKAKFQAVAFLAITILGILICIIWYLNIRSYRQLNSGKFKVISELEQQLPFACYNKEWEFLKKDGRYKGYLTQTTLEKVIPLLLAVPYVGLFVYSALDFLF